jgi:hypothetical protein
MDMGQENLMEREKRSAREQLKPVSLIMPSGCEGKILRMFYYLYRRKSIFLIDRSDWRATNPPLTPTISLNTSNQNFEIAIFFHIVEKSGN